MIKLVFESEKMLIFQAQLGEWDNLNHLLICKSTQKALIIDPFSGNFWKDYCLKNNWFLEQSWLTHSHWDHTKGIEELPSCEIWIHKLEFERGWVEGHTHMWTHQPWTSIGHQLGNLNFNIHCTPGHTPGHVTIIGEGVFITGDCLFIGRCGRVDLFGGSEEDQKRSLQYLQKILVNMEGNTLVLPGHQYVTEDGSNPTFCTVDDLLKENLALLAANNDEAWSNLEFLSFDDSMAEQARRQRARHS